MRGIFAAVAGAKAEVAELRIKNRGHFSGVILD
jgi:hypothetical protein